MRKLFLYQDILGEGAADETLQNIATASPSLTGIVVLVSLSYWNPLKTKRKRKRERKRERERERESQTLHLTYTT